MLRGQKYAYPLELMFDVLFGIAMVSIIEAAYWATQRQLTKKSVRR
jgi:hypothetical protein